MNSIESKQSRLDRALGSLVGLATGDALGTTLEFKSPGSFEPLTDMVGGGPFELRPGQWTDDTSMALCLAESLLESGGFDMADQMQRYVRWWKKGYLSSNGICFDVGCTVSGALYTFVREGDPLCGSNDPFTAGNGSIMRLAPIPIYFRNPIECIEYSELSSRSTHQAPTCLGACRYMGGMISGLLEGATKEEALSPNYRPRGVSWEERPLDPKIGAIAAGSFKKKNPPQIAGTGYAVQSLEAALWAFHHSTSFEEGALMAVNLGDDADTTGAVYGQIAGAYYGLSGIPEQWVQKLAKLDLILNYAKRLNDASIP